MYLFEIFGQQLNEMANLQQHQTGLFGVVFCSVDMAKHGCRIKFRPNNVDGSITITLPDCIVALDTLPKGYSDFEKKKVVYFAVKNTDTFLSIWNLIRNNRGYGMESEIAKLQPITNQDKRAIQQTKLIHKDQK